ncbi:GEVED domain-containing protein [Flavobacterium sp.]|uniref:Ig-like domain-containing protein n=1 Tax=Flavobacterium sp. TaxID=239 RepID=UPI0039E5B0E8
MIINYNSLRNGRDTWLKKDVGDVIGSPPTIPWKRSRTTWLTSLLLLIGLLAGGNLQAQISGYTFAQSTATYVPLGGSPATVHASGWDDNVASVSIPFTFVYNGGNFTSVSVNSNGYLTFGTTVSSTTLYTPLSDATAYNGAVAAFARDLISNSSTVVSGIEGSSPNRVLVIQWNNARRYSLGAISGDVMNFQIRLYEGTNQVQIRYGTCTATSTTSYTLQTGLRGGSAADYNNRTTTTNWASSTAGTSNSATMTTLNTILPASGLTFTWSPPPSCAGTPTPGTIPSAIGFCSGSAPGAISITGYSTGVANIAFQWEESDDNGVGDPWANAVGGSGATSATYQPPTLSATRYYRAKVTCTNGGAFDYTNVATASSVNCSFDIAKTAATFTSIAATGSSISSWRNGNNTDDNMSNNVPIGFNFSYKGGTYQNVLVSTNGFVTFNTGTSSIGNTTAPYNYENNTFTATSSGTYLTLAPFYEDLVTAGNPGTLAGLQASIKYLTTGSSPNRVFTVEWIGSETFNNAGPNLNFQVKLYETTGVVEYVYGTMELFNGTANYGYGYTIGLNGATVSASPTVVQLQSQQVDNVQNFSNVAKNNLDRFLDCNVKYTFTPGNYSGAGSAPTLLNDEPAGAITLGVNSSPCTTYCGTYYTSNGATASAGITACTAGTPGTPDDDVWFKFTTGNFVADHTIKLLGGGGYNAVVQLFSDAGTTSISCVNATAEGFTETLTAAGLLANTTYYVRVYHAGTGANTAAPATGNTTSGGVPDFSICVSLVVPPPANDNPCGAITLTPSTTCTPYNDTAVTSTTSILNATNTTSNGVTTPTCSGAATVNDVWFKFTATSSTHGATVTAVPGFDVALQGYTIASGTCGGNDLVLTPIGCVNGGSTGVTEQVVLTTTAGQEYYIRVYRHPSGVSGAPVSNSQFSICFFNPIPTCTTNSSPSNAATGVSTTPTLSWAQVSYAEGYDIYLGTTSGPTTLLASTTGATSTSYTLTAGQALSSLTTYYWYVVPKNANGMPTCGAANETSFTVMNTCVAPTGLGASALTTTTATVSWGSVAAAGVGYQYEVRTSGTPGSGGATASGSTLTGDLNDDVVGLTAATSYTLYVRSECSTGVFSDWSTGYVFSTVCDATNVPYTQNFESTTAPAIPTCTTIENAGTGNNWITSSTNGASYGFLSNALNYVYNSSSAANAWWYTRGLNLTANTTYRISYRYGGTGTTFVERLKVAYGTSPGNAAMTNAIADHPNVNFSVPVTNTVDFTPTATGVYYIGFNAYSIADRFYLFVDDISVIAAPPAITSFAPMSVCQNADAAGRTVVITGTMLANVTGVDFNGVPAVSFNVDSNTQITAVAPASVGATGFITVTDPNTMAASTGTFTVNAAPTVADITAPGDATNICMPDTLTLSNVTPTGVWSSSDIDIATVSGSGVVTPVDTGAVTITYTVTDGVTGCSTAKTYDLTISEPVQIVSSTPTQTTTIGGNTSFSVVASGTGNPGLTYQWQVNTDETGETFTDVVDGTNFSGATTATLNLTDVPASFNNYFFQCVVTGVCNSVISDLAILIVGETGIVTHPSNVTICDSGTGEAQFTVEGSPDVETYQWQEDQGGDNWQNLSNAGMYSGTTTATLTLTGVTSVNNTWRYKCIVTGNGTAESNPASLFVIESASVDTDPTAQSVCYTGGSAVFTVGASGGIASYQWQLSTNGGGSWNAVANGTPVGATYTGASSANLTVNTTAATPVANYLYRAMVNATAPCANVPSQGAQLIINQPAITGQPANTSVFGGNTATFTVGTSAGSPTYQWQYATALAGPYSNVVNGTPAGVTYNNATTATLSVVTSGTVAVSSARYYRAVVSSPVGCSSNSNGGQLTINNYCLPTYGAGPGTVDQIANVSVGTLNNPTGSLPSPYYTVYENVNIPDFTRSTTVNVSVTFGNDTTNNCGIWVDFNQNGVFDTSEAFLSTAASAGATTANGTSVIAIPIPAGAVLGKTRMRVRGGEDTVLTATQACGASSDSDGEAEDYYVNIVPLPECSTPVAGTISASLDSVCTSGSVVLTATGYSTNQNGISLQWYNSSGAIATATNPTYTTPVLTAPETYYLRVTCANGGAFADTASKTIDVVTPAVLTTTPGSRCGTGTVALSATASPGTVLKWYAAASGGAPLFTGTNFTTPSIAASTNYYVAAETAGGAGYGQVGTATTLTVATEQPTAFCNRWPQYRAQHVFTAAELTAAGLTAGKITSITLNISTLGDSANNANFIVKMGTTASSTLTTTFVTGLPTVFGPATYTHAVGLNKITFNTPFDWNGTSNVIVEISHSGADNINNSQTYYTATAGNTVVWSNAVAPTTGTTSVNRMNIIFDGTLCSSARSTVAATVTAPPALTISAAAATICSGTPSNLVTITSPLANFDSYFWTPSTGVTGTAATGYTFNASSSTAYTLTGVQSSGDLCQNIAAFNLTVNPTPATPVISQASTTICNGDIVPLNIGTSSTTTGTGIFGAGTTSQGTLSYPNPFSGFYGGAKHQMIITASELTAQGLAAGSNITSVSFNISAFTAAACANLTIRMGNTALTALTGFVTGTTAVYGPTTYTPSATGLVTFTLTTPYTWNGTSNLVVETVHNAGNGGNGSGTTTFNTTTATNTVYYGAKDSVTGGIAGFDSQTTYGVNGASNQRPNMRFGFTTSLIPSWSPAAGLYTDAGATVPYVSGPAATVYAKPATTSSYTATVSSSAGCPATSAATTITVNQFYPFYVDVDGDHYGTGAPVSLCAASASTPPTGYAAVGGDCNDAVAAINPGHAEVLYNGVDDNCDGNLDEGNQLVTQLLAASCGATLTSIGSLIGIQTIAPASTITRWRIRATNGAQVQTIETNVPHFTMPQFPSYAYATTYTIAIELQRNGVWLGYYGPNCFVSTPAILEEGGAAAVSPSQCGITLPKINTLIATTSIQGVTGYRFRVTNLTDVSGPNAVQTIDRTQNWFSLQMLTRYNYGTTYRIEVAVKTTGTYGGYGSPCEVSSPAVPSLVNCGGVATSGTQTIAATSVSGATQYRFQITRQSDNASTTIDRSTNYFVFNAVPSSAFTAGALYTVRVAVMTTGTWSPFGDACEITAPGGTAKVAAGTGQSSSDLFRAQAMPNPFTADFGIDVMTSNKGNVQLMVYDMLGKLIESREVKLEDLSVEKIGSNYPSGVYNVIVTQDNVVKTLRVIKR